MKPGESWRPETNLEDERFITRLCGCCSRDYLVCPIRCAMLGHEKDEPAYPAEITRDGDGRPTCTAFSLHPEIREAQESLGRLEALRRLGWVSSSIAGSSRAKVEAYGKRSEEPC